MKKLLSFIAILSILGIASIAFGAGIPTANDPQSYPEIWTIGVYNNSGVALTSGTVVVWDMDSDTSDASFAYRTMWVTRTTTADDIQVAGVVVSDSIAVGGVGTICIFGPVYALVADSTDAVTANQIVGTTTVAGQCGAYADTTDTGALGWCIYASGVAVANGGYSATDGVDFIMMPIFVNPSVSD